MDRERSERLDRSRDQFLLLAALDDRLREGAAREAPCELIALTRLLDAPIRAAAAKAAEKLADDVREFGDDRGTPTPAKLRARLAITVPAVETVLGLNHAANYGLE